MLGELSRAELLALMRRAAIFAAPARYEPFGLAVLEAAAAGCALVLSDIASFRELWDGAALFVDPGDPTALLGALDRLCRDAALRQQLQRRAARRARRYSISAMANGYRRAYEDVLTAPASPFAARNLPRGEAHA
jgi:glycosyltransferase involved in cell wall biosynthesis